MDYAKLLKKTIEQEEKFLFPEFKREWIPELADCIFKYAEKYKDESNVGLEIWVNDFCVYRYYQPGLGPIFANYVRRKRGTVTMWGTSSMRKKAEFGVAKETLATHALPEADYIICGGGFPIKLKNSGDVIGFIGFTGLTDAHDHECICGGLEAFFKKHKFIK